MKEEKSGGSGLFGAFLEIWKDIFGTIWKTIPTVFSFTLWVCAAFVVLPAVFIAGVWYPSWQKWGEKF